jgi:hypothetical protein
MWLGLICRAVEECDCTRGLCGNVNCIYMLYISWRGAHFVRYHLALHADAEKCLQCSGTGALEAFYYVILARVPQCILKNPGDQAVVLGLVYHCPVASMDVCLMFQQQHQQLLQPLSVCMHAWSVFLHVADL